MKPLYRTAFQLGRVDDPLNAIHEITQVCLDWVFLHKGEPRKGISRPGTLGKHAQDFPMTAVGNNRQVESRYWKGAHERLWALRLTHPDDKDPGIEWCVELTLECTNDQAKFTCAQTIRRNDLEARGLDRPASQPGVIPQLIAKYGACVGDFQLNGLPIALVAKKFNCEILRELLLYSLRYPFVVLMSPGPDGAPLVDATLWAKKLSPLAFVFVAESAEAAKLWEDAIGTSEYACWGGAIRVYRPGFTLSDDPLSHPFYRPDEIAQSLVGRREVDLADEIVAKLTAESLFQGHAEFSFWSEMNDRISKAHIQVMQAETADESELSKLYARDVELLRVDLRLAAASLEALQQEMNTMKRWKDVAQRAHRQIRTEGVPPAQALRDLPEVDSVAAAIALAAVELADAVEFPLNSKSDRETPFVCPTDVLYAFRWLGGTFRRSKMGHLVGVDLEKDFAAYLPTWLYAPNQSEVTIGKNPEWYAINYSMPPGQEPVMRMHLSCGKDRRPEKCIRIGFIWDAKRAIVAVGYVGQHQKSGNS